MIETSILERSQQLAVAVRERDVESREVLAVPARLGVAATQEADHLHLSRLRRPHPARRVLDDDAVCGCHAHLALRRRGLS